MRKSILILFLILCSVCPAANEIVFLLWFDGHVNSLNPAAEVGFGDELPDGTGARLAAFGDLTLPLAVAKANDYDGLGTDVDVFVAGGDNIDEAVIGAVRNANFKELRDRIDGTVGNILTASGGKVYPLLGHHDLGGTGTAPYENDDYLAFFHADGMGDIMPALGAGEGQIDNQWWPTAVDDDKPCAYTVAKNGFRLIFLCAIMNDIGLLDNGETDAFGGDAEVKTLVEWLELMLDEAQAAGEPAIIFSHQPIETNDPGTTALLHIGARNQAINLFATGNGGVTYTIPIIVVSGHAHRDQSVITSAGVVYINVGGDVWGTSLTDTGRFSHAVLEVTSPTYNTPDGNRGLITLTGYGFQRSLNMSQSLVGHWKLDEPDGTAAGGTIVDSSSNGYDGTKDATAAVVSVSAPLGHGITFNGTTDFINGSDTIIIDYPLSLNIWLRSTSSTKSILLSIADVSEETRYFALRYTAGGTLEYLFRTTGVESQAKVAGAIAVDDGIWHMVTGVSATNNDHKIYVDSVLINSSSTEKTWDTGAVVMDAWAIGRMEKATPAELFTGDLSDARIFSGGLSAEDVAKLYSAGTAGLRWRGSGKKNPGLARTGRNRI